MGTDFLTFQLYLTVITFIILLQYSDRSPSDSGSFNSSPVNKRITSHVPQQSPACSSPLLGGSSNRHTTIVGPSSPIHSMLPQSLETGDDAPPPPLPGRDSRRPVTRSPSNNSVNSSNSSINSSSNTVSIIFLF